MNYILILLIIISVHLHVSFLACIIELIKIEEFYEIPECEALIKAILVIPFIFLIREYQRRSWIRQVMETDQ